MEKVRFEHFGQLLYLAGLELRQTSAEDKLILVSCGFRKFGRRGAQGDAPSRTELVCRRHHAHQLWIMRSFPGAMVPHHNFKQHWGEVPRNPNPTAHLTVI